MRLGSGGDIRFARGEVELEKRQLLGDDGVVPLTTIEVALLRYLAERPGRAVSRGELLQNVWGYHASVQSRAVDQTVKRLRRKIEADATHPLHLITEHGKGYRLDPIENKPTRGTLELPADPFIGRTGDLEELDTLAAQTNVIVLVGPGGMGKTRLAKEWASRRTWPGGAWTIALPMEAGGDLEALVTAALPGAGPGEERLAALGQAIVIIDGAEAAMADLAPLVDGWHHAAPDVFFLVTSQHRPRIAAQQTLELLGLDPEAGSLLFTVRADAVSHGAASRDPNGVANLVAVLQGVPLALELAALRVRLFSPSEIVTRFAASPSLLKGGGRALEGAMAWSWSLLDPPIAAFLQRIAGVFRGGFTAQAAEAILEAGETDVLEGLAVLRDTSWLSLDPDGRFRIVGPLRPFVERRAEPDPADLQRHAAFYVEQAEADHGGEARSGWGLPKRSSHEVANLVRAMEAAADPELAGRAGVMAASFLGLGPTTQTRYAALIERALLLLPDGAFRCSGLRMRGFFLAIHGEVDKADADFEASRELGKRLGRADLVEHTLLDWGKGLNRARLTARAKGVLSATLLPRQSPSLGIDIELELGRALCQLGEAEAARACLERAKAQVSTVRDGALRVAYTEGYMELELGNPARSFDAFQTVLRLCEQVGRPDLGALLVGLPAEAALVLGDLKTARIHMEQGRAATLSRPRVSARNLAEDEVNLTRLCLFEGDAAAAEEHGMAAVAALRRPRGAMAVELRGLLALAMTMQGREGEARIELAEATRWVEKDDGDVVAVHGLMRALFARVQGQEAEAVTLVAEACRVAPGAPLRQPVPVRMSLALLERWAGR